MNKNLLILGAGQYGTVIKEIAISMGCFDKIDFLDDAFGDNSSDEKYHEQSIGKLNDYESKMADYAFAIVSIGKSETRKLWTEKLIGAGFKIPVIVSPKSFVGRTSQLGYGAVVEPMAVVHENVSVGIGSFISAGAVVNHNSIVGSFCHIDNNAVVMSGALVKELSNVEPCYVIYPSEISKRTPVGDGYNFDDMM